MVVKSAIEYIRLIWSAIGFRKEMERIPFIDIEASQVAVMTTVIDAIIGKHDSSWYINNSGQIVEFSHSIICMVDPLCLKLAHHLLT